MSITMTRGSICDWLWSWVYSLCLIQYKFFVYLGTQGKKCRRVTLRQEELVSSYYLQVRELFRFVSQKPSSLYKLPSCWKIFVPLIKFYTINLRLQWSGERDERFKMWVCSRGRPTAHPHRWDLRLVSNCCPLVANSEFYWCLLLLVIQVHYLTKVLVILNQKK